MKIKFKNTNILNEDALKNPAKILADNSAFEFYEASIKKQFIQELKKDNVLVNVVLGDDLSNPIVFPKAPIDFSNVMSSIQTNKSKKTRDLLKWNIDDPITTYNEAEDLCLTIFGNSTKSTFATNKNDVTLNKANNASESVLFNLNNSLNEATGLETGLANGAAISSTINNDMGIGAGLVATAGTTIATHLAIIAGISTGIGKLAGLNTDATPNGVKRDKESNELNDPRKLLLINLKSDQEVNFSNALASIKSYVERILESINNFVLSVSPNSVLSYRKISKFVIQYMHQSTSSANEFVETRLPEIEELENKREKRRETKLLNQLYKARETEDFSKAINALLKNINNGADALKILEIQKYYEKHSDKRDILLDAADKNKEELFSTFDSIVKTTKNKKDPEEKEQESLNINFNNSLNEAEEELGKGNKPDLPLDKIYNNLSSKLKLEFNELFDSFDKSKLEGLDDAKENMKFLIEEADKTIKDRIEKVTKSSTTGSSNDSGLTKAAIQFLAGHPLEADNLLEIWSRHLVDLKLRMSSRLKTMTDINNTSRTLGWSVNFVKTIVPEILARLLTYRYAYQVLSQKGIYTYDTAKAKKDSEFYDNNPEIANAYKYSELGMLTWLLSNVTKDYTNNGQSLIAPSEDGGFKINDNYLAYATLFCNRLRLPLRTGMGEETINVAVTLSQLNKNEDINKSNDALLTIIKGRLESNASYVMMRRSIDHENNEDAEKYFNKLYNRLLLSDEDKKAKELISNAFNNIQKLISENKISNDNYENIYKSLNIVYSLDPYKIYETYTKNKDIEKLIEEFKKAANNNDEKTLNKIREDVHNTFSNIDFVEFNQSDKTENNTNVYKSTIDEIFKTNVQVDYYSYIASFNKNLEPGKDFNNIEETCKVVPVLVKLALSGVLSYVEEKDKSEVIDVAKIDELIKLVKEPCAKLAAYNTISKAEITVSDDYKALYDENNKFLKLEYNECLESIIKLYKNSYADTTENKAKVESNKTRYIFELNNDILSELINNIAENIAEKYDSTKLMDALAEFDVKNGESTIKFKDKEISENDKNILTYNLVNAINSVKDTNEYKKVVKTIESAINIASK